MNAGEEQPSERECSAFHESGHAVVAFLEELHFMDVTIEADPQAGTSGGVHYDDQVGERLDRITRESSNGLSDADQRFVESVLASTLGGPIAEEGLTGLPNSHGALRDKRSADELCRKVTRATGLAQRMHDKMRCHAEKLIREEPGPNRVAAVAKALLDHTTLTYCEVEAIIQKGETPDAQEDKGQRGSHGPRSPALLSPNRFSLLFAMKMTRNIHWISLAISPLVLIHAQTLGGRYPDWLLVGLPFTALSVSVTCGIFMIRNHRSYDRFLPPAEYVTYGVAALGWSWLVLAIAHDFTNMGHRAYWVAAVLPLLMFAGPWLAFRRSRGSPMVIDAALVITAVALAHAVTTPMRHAPSISSLVSDGYQVLPFPIAVTAWFLYRMKKAGVPELWTAIGCGGAVVISAWVLLPKLS